MRQSNYKSSFSTKISTLRIFRCTHIVIQFHIHIILHCYIMQLKGLDVKVSFYNRHLSKDIAVFNLYIKLAIRIIVCYTGRCPQIY